MFQTRLLDLLTLGQNRPDLQLYFKQATETIDAMVAQLTPLFPYVSEEYKVQVEPLTEPVRSNVHNGDYKLTQMRLVQLGKYFYVGLSTEFELFMDQNGKVHQAYRCKGCVFGDGHLKIRTLPEGNRADIDVTTEYMTLWLTRRICEGKRIQDNATTLTDASLAHLSSF